MHFDPKWHGLWFFVCMFLLFFVRVCGCECVCVCYTRFGIIMLFEPKTNVSFSPKEIYYSSVIRPHFIAKSAKSANRYSPKYQPDISDLKTPRVRYFSIDDPGFTQTYQRDTDYLLRVKTAKAECIPDELCLLHGLQRFWLFDPWVNRKPTTFTYNPAYKSMFDFFESFSWDKPLNLLVWKGIMVKFIWDSDIFFIGSTNMIMVE